MSIITVPKSLREKLGDDGSEALVEVINKTLDEQKTDVIKIVGEKFERRLSEEISGVNQRIERLRTELKKDNANLRADIIKWMFLFWAGQAATIVGALAILLR